MNFVKFLTTPFLQNNFGQLLLSVGNILGFIFKTVEYYTILNALNPTFNFILMKFTSNSLLEKNSVFQNHYFIGKKASEIKKNFFLYFLLKLFVFLLHLLIENLNRKTTVPR